MMDDQKKIRLCEPNKDTQMWKQLTTLELPERDMNNIVYNDFDEYCVSDGVLHTNDKLYFLLDSKAKDNATWASQDFMIENHLHVSGPRYAKESGMIWYMQQHAALAEDDEHDHDDEVDFGGDHGHSHFKGYSVVMQPLGDLSYVDLLPQRGVNNNNFITFISEEHIMVNYSGRYLIFSLVGQFLGQV